MENHTVKSSTPQRYVDSGNSMNEAGSIGPAFADEPVEEHDDGDEDEEEEPQGISISCGCIIGTSSVQNSGQLLRDASAMSGARSDVLTALFSSASGASSTSQQYFEVASSAF